MGTRNNIKNIFTYQKMSYAFNPPWMHEKMYKSLIVNQKDIANAKKMNNFTTISPQIVKGIRNRVGTYILFPSEK